MRGQDAAVVLLQQADEAFAYAQHDAALAAYTALYEQGFWQEEMLYRLAWLHEQAGDYAEAIYYLRQVQWAYGGVRIEEKVAALMAAHHPARLPVGRGWTAYEQMIHRQSDWLHALLIGGTLLALSSWLGIRQRWGGWLGLVPALLALGVGGILGEQQLHRPHKAVILEPTACYAAPGFAAPYQHLPLAPGATVDLGETSDIWCHISLPPFGGWVPCHRLRPVGPSPPLPLP